jgi:hypothetical protein
MRDMTPTVSEIRGRDTITGLPTIEERLTLTWASVGMSWLILFGVATVLAAAVVFDDHDAHATAGRAPVVYVKAPPPPAATCLDEIRTTDRRPASRLRNTGG